MLNSYHRRAFIALAVLAPTTATPAARADEATTLWEALNHVERPPARSLSDPDEPVRVPLGAVPGFTLPALDRVGDPGASKLGKRKTYSGPLAPVNRLWDQLMTATGSSITPRGSASMQFRKDSTKGGSQATQAYQSANYLGQGSNGVYSNAEMQVDATMFKYLHYSSTISTNPYSSPGQNRVKLDYNTPGTRIQVGDINAGFQGNSLIDFNRYLSGVEMEKKWSKQFKTTTLFSTIKAETKSLTITGNNSAGPFYLFSGQIVDGSAHVRVDNHDMVAGTDYTLDPTTSELRFLHGNVILQSQTIAITYETLGYGQQLGAIYGFRTQYLPGGNANVGMTYVTQQTPRGVTLQQRKQQFQGQEAALASYTLDVPIDTTKVFTVSIDGILLKIGTPASGDYFIDSAFANVIHLRNPVPSIQNVIVTYYPLDTTQNPGNRSVIGLDGHTSLGKLGGLTLETAVSGVSLGNTSYPGKAAQLRLDLNPFKNLTTHFTLRDVGAAYSSVQTPGFNRNEKSVEMSGEYLPTSKLHLSFEVEQAKRPSYTATSLGTAANATSAYAISSAGSDTYNQYTLGATYDLSRSVKVNVSRNSLGTQYLVGGQSTSLSDNLTLTMGKKSFNVDVGLIRSNNDTSTLASQYGLVATTTSAPGVTTPTANGLYSIHTSTLTKRMGATWQPFKWLNLNGSLSDNAITNTGTGYTNGQNNTNATDRQITARFQPPIKGLTFSYAYDLSDTGNAPNALGVTTAAAGIGTAITTGATGTTVSAAGTTASSAASVGTAVSPVTGIASTRSFFAPWVAPVTRDGATTTSATAGFGTTVATAGGGINSTLGSAGNYSGFLGSSSTGVGLSSLSGRTGSNRLGMNYAIRRGLSLQMNYDFASSVGDYQYDNTRKTALANLVWNPSERWAFNGSYNVSRVAYISGTGNTRSDQMQFGFSGRPFGNKISTSLSFQSVHTNSALNTLAASTGGLTGVANGSTLLAGGSTLLATGSATNSNLSSVAARIDYPLSVRHALFIDWLNSVSTGYLGASERDLRFGMDFYLSQFLKFSLGWQTTDRVNSDSTLASSNYHNSSLLAEFGLHF